MSSYNEVIDPEIVTALMNGAGAEMVARIAERVRKEQAELAERGKAAQAAIDAANERERQANAAKLEAERREAAETQAEFRRIQLGYEAHAAYTAYLAEQDRARREAWIERYIADKLAAETAK